MKKIMLLAMIMGFMFSSNAQQTPTTQEVVVYKLSRTNNSLPAGTVAGYDKETRTYYVYYDQKNVNYHPALPVLQNNVPEEVVNMAVKKYGSVVYGITRIKAYGNTDVYQVRLMENGTTRLEWMNADGTTPATLLKANTDDVVAAPAKIH